MTSHTHISGETLGHCNKTYMLPQAQVMKQNKKLIGKLKLLGK